MRDDNMPVSEVQRQVEAVALAVKQGSSVSDLRHHTFTGKLKRAQVGPDVHCLKIARHAFALPEAGAPAPQLALHSGTRACNYRTLRGSTCMCQVLW